MKKPIVFMFSGQGSQYYQMGRELYESNPVFKYWMDQGELILKGLNQPSLLASLYYANHPKSEPFNSTLLTHPAIFIVEHALSQVLLSQNIIPDLLLGTSLGEFAAAVLAQVISFETALQLIVAQANYLEQQCPAGGMLAILASPQLYTQQSLLYETSELVAVNFSSHFVVSSLQSSIETIQTELKRQNIACQALAVSHAFHSSYIGHIAPDYLALLKNYQFKTPAIPLRSCVYPKQNLLFIPPSHCWDIARQPIQFMTAIACLEKEGSHTYLDLGPSGTLATFVKYNLPSTSQSQVKAIMTPMGTEVVNPTRG